MRPSVDIVLPCFNPPAAWHRSAQDFFHYIKPKFNVRFIIVDDGSTTGDIKKTVGGLKEEMTAELVTLAVNKGKGYALREGVKIASAPYILYTDIDLPFTNTSMEEVLNKLCNAAPDIVAGHRGEAYYEGTMTPFRRRLSRTFRFFMKHVLRISLHDTQCGLKAFNQKGRELFLATTINRYLFDFEFIYNALRDPNISLATVKVELKSNIVFSRMRWPVLMRESANLVKVLASAGFKRKRRLPQRG